MSAPLLADMDLFITQGQQEEHLVTDSRAVVITEDSDVGRLPRLEDNRLQVDLPRSQLGHNRSPIEE